MEVCNHDFRVCGYNSAIVIEECSICCDEKEYDFDYYYLVNGFPVIAFEED